MTTAAAQDEITHLLTSLKTNGVKSVALTTLEGRSLGSTIVDAGPRFKLGALSAASLAIGTKAAGELVLGGLDQVHILASDGSLLLTAVGHKALLSVVLERGVDFTSVIRDMKRVVSQLGSLV